MAELKTFVVILLSMVSILICAPLVMLFHAQFRRKSHMIMIKKRHPKILHLNGIFICLWFIIGFPITIVNFSGIIENKTANDIITRIDYIVYPIIGMGMFLSLAWRFWHMFYDLMYGRAMQKSFSGFVNQLDPTAVSNQHKSKANFWLNHKKKLGSDKWMKKSVLTYYFTTVITVIICYQILVNAPTVWVAHLFSQSLHSISTAAALFFALKVPSHFSDHFFVGHEMRIILSQLLISVLFGVIAVSINVLFVTDEEEAQWFLVIATSLGSLLILNIFLISFVYIPKRIMSANNKLAHFQQKNEELRKVEAEAEEAQVRIDAMVPQRSGDTSVQSKSEFETTRTETDNTDIYSLRFTPATVLQTIPSEGVDKDEEEKDGVPGPRLISITERRPNIPNATDDLKDFVRRVSISKTEAQEIINMRRQSFSPRGTPASPTGKRQSVNLADIMLSDLGFKEFMSSLAKDLSTECLLCFVEIVQFKFLMKQRYDKVDPGAIPIDMGFTDQYPLYGIVPMSQINRRGFGALDLNENVSEEDLMTACKRIVFQIYRKYIRTGAELRVNISSEMRHDLKVKIGNEDLLMERLNITAVEIFSIFDGVATRMLDIMKAFPTFQTACNALNEPDLL